MPNNPLSSPAQAPKKMARMIAIKIFQGAFGFLLHEKPTIYFIINDTNFGV